MHGDKIFYKCKLCEKAFSKPEELNIHANESHNSGNIIFKCDQCEQVFGKQENLNVHLLLHKEKQISALPNSLVDMSVSKSCVTGSNPSGALFSKSQQQQTQKVNIVKLSTLEKADLKKCEICGQMFTNIDLLTSHMNIKHGVVHKDKQITKLWSDAKGDTGSNPSGVKYPDAKKCEICKQKFTNMHFLRSHILKKHGKA